ncbi:MAG: T9SS C-terminal target domain-containing protein [Ignavibacteriae bacterium]|nr:MAG: T9SS C-terminal target domain-containing protein [Ignavibacteriota bacterium]
MGIYEYSFPLVGINDPGSNIPKEFALHQNYPNPFNPATYINYDIPKASNVTITVYNINGKEVSTLVNEFKQAGAYSISFNASSLASGVYFYKITAGDFTATKKMTLIK